MPALKLKEKTHLCTSLNKPLNAKLDYVIQQPMLLVPAIFIDIGLSFSMAQIPMVSD